MFHSSQAEYLRQKLNEVEAEVRDVKDVRKQSERDARLAEAAKALKTQIPGGSAMHLTLMFLASCTIGRFQGTLRAGSMGGEMSPWSSFPNPGMVIVVILPQAMANGNSSASFWQQLKRHHCLLKLGLPCHPIPPNMQVYMVV